MNIARCLQDGNIYEAHGFSQLPLEEREAKRQELICPNDDCKGPAFYRRESRSGQAACFGARHVDGCDMAAAEAAHMQGTGGEEENHLLNPGDRLEIDLGYGAHTRINIETTDESNIEGQRRSSRYLGDGDRQNAVKRQRLQPLLKTLVHYPEYANQKISVSIPDQKPTPANELFVPFDKASEVPVGNFYALWGLIASARYAGETLWVNAGGAASVSFPMEKELQTTLQERLSVEQKDLVKELAGCHFLVLGTLSRGGLKSKLYCTPKSALHVAIIRDTTPN